MRPTTNGFLFLGIGAAALGAAYFMNIPPLRAVGLMLILLPLLSLLSLVNALGSAGSLGINGVRFDCPGGRTVPEEGVASPLRFTLRNSGTAASPAGSLTITAAESLGVAGTLSVPSLAPNETAEFELPCRPAVRGEHSLGPFVVSRHGVLGLARRSAPCLMAHPVAVGPRMFEVPELEQMARSTGGLAPRSVRHGFDVRDFTTRSYERGDDIRFVHWGSTARHGELMVRNETGSIAPSAAVVLDTYESGYPRRKYFEWSVCAAAAATWSLLRAGYDVDLVTQGRPVEHFSAGWGRQEAMDRCLTVFAAIAPTNAGPMSAGPVSAGPVNARPAGGEAARGVTAGGASSAGIVLGLTGSSASGAARLSGMTAGGGAALRFALCHDDGLLDALADYRFTGAAIDPRTTSVVAAWTHVLEAANK